MSFVLGKLRARHEQHEAEAARVVIYNVRAAIEFRSGHDRARESRDRSGDESWPGTSSSTRNEPDIPRWSDQDIAVVEIGEKIFGAARQRRDRAPGQPFGEILGERKAQIRATRLDLGEDASDKRRFQAAAYGFDFGKFGHG